MDLSVKEYLDGLLTREALETPSDSVKPDELDLQLPKWYDKKKFEQARRFYRDNCFMLASSMLLGLVAVLAVPSILKVLIGSRRSNSVYTAYKRYVSTKSHVDTWFNYELKPGTVSWKSLFTVRSRHQKAGTASRLKGGDVVSQRDLALTQFGFIGFAVLKPHKFGIRQIKEGDWEAYNHFWRVIGHMIGIEDRYNICRKNIDETREVCQAILDHVYTPCLENPPEYFEHMSRVMLDGMWCINPTIDISSTLYWTKHLADVPGYIYTEHERIDLLKKLKKHIGDSDKGVDGAQLLCKPAVEGLPSRSSRLILRPEDYSTIESAPTYKILSPKGKFKLNMIPVMASIYDTYLGKLYFNLNYWYAVFLMNYFPYLAFFRFGVKESFVNIFKEDPVDDAVPKPNEEFFKPEPPQPWYVTWWSFIW